MKGERTLTLPSVAEARRLLESETDLAIVVEIVRCAEAFELYAQEMGDRQLLADAAEINLRAQRRAGQLLIERGEPDEG